MIIKKIAKLCKRAGAVVLWYDARHDTQWISNGSAAWPLYGMPLLDAENVLTVLDIPEKDWPTDHMRRCRISSHTCPGILPRAWSTRRRSGTRKRTNSLRSTQRRAK